MPAFHDDADRKNALVVAGLALRAYRKGKHKPPMCAGMWYGPFGGGTASCIWSWTGRPCGDWRFQKGTSYHVMGRRDHEGVGYVFRISEEEWKMREGKEAGYWYLGHVRILPNNSTRAFHAKAGVYSTAQVGWWGACGEW